MNRIIPWPSTVIHEDRAPYILEGQDWVQGLAMMRNDDCLKNCTLSLAENKSRKWCYTIVEWIVDGENRPYIHGSNKDPLLN